MRRKDLENLVKHARGYIVAVIPKGLTNKAKVKSNYLFNIKEKCKKIVK